jgi:hypothetical protein
MVYLASYRREDTIISVEVPNADHLLNLSEGELAVALTTQGLKHIHSRVA